MNKYQIVIFAVVIAVASAGVIKEETQTEKDRITEVHKKCQDDPATHTDEDMIKKIHDGDFTEDEKAKIHMLCMAKGLHILKENGDLNTEDLKTRWAEHYDGDQLTKLQACLIQKDTPMDTAWELFKCQHEVIGHSHHHHHH